MELSMKSRFLLLLSLVLVLTLAAHPAPSQASGGSLTTTHAVGGTYDSSGPYFDITVNKTLTITSFTLFNLSGTGQITIWYHPNGTIACCTWSPNYLQLIADVKNVTPSNGNVNVKVTPVTLSPGQIY